MYHEHWQLLSISREAYQKYREHKQASQSVLIPVNSKSVFHTGRNQKAEVSFFLPSVLNCVAHSFFFFPTFILINAIVNFSAYKHWIEIIFQSSISVRGSISISCSENSPTTLLYTAEKNEGNHFLIRG